MPLFEKLRETYGFDHHLLHDGHHRYTPQEAANLGKMLEPYQLFWLEDCTPAENQEAFRLIRHHIVPAAHFVEFPVALSDHLIAEPGEGGGVVAGGVDIDVAGDLRFLTGEMHWFD